MSSSSLSGNVYYVSFIDDFSRKTSAKLMKIQSNHSKNKKSGKLMKIQSSTHLEYEHTLQTKDK